MSDFDEHAARIRAFAEPGGPLHRQSPHVTIRNEEWFGRDENGLPQVTELRGPLHKRLLKDWARRYPDVKNDRHAIVLAGPPGAGKSTSQAELIRASGIPEEDWCVINNDDFKDQLLKAALDDGTYRSDLLPPELAQTDVKPRELATLVHDEAGILADAATDRAITDGKNLIFDSTLSNAAWAHDFVDRLEEAGYDVRIAVVDAPREVVEARVRHRWKTGYLAAEEGLETDDDPLAAKLGGRSVPSGVIRHMYEHDDSSRCVPIAQEVAERHTCVSEYRASRVSEPAGKPRLQERRGRLQPGGPLLDAEPYGAARTASAFTPPALRPHVTAPAGRAAPKATPVPRPDRGAER